MEKLIIFTRYPDPGRVKTRLIPLLGASGAASLHRNLAEQTIRTARVLADRRNVSTVVFYDGGNARKIQAWLGRDVSCRPQSGADIGWRMAGALKAALEEGASKAVLIGTDIPDLTSRLLEEAFASLDRQKMVVGPAADGGYYLIGLHNGAMGRDRIPTLFAGVPWGTDRVFEETLKRIRKMGISCHRLKRLKDIDRPEDLHERCRRTGRVAGRPGKPYISVIIPTLNEAGSIDDTLSHIRPRSGSAEIIVVDGGSRDETAKRVTSSGIPLIRCPAGRAGQMNAGAEAAGGEILLFLHADTRLPEGFDRCIRQLFRRPNIAAGAFELRIHGNMPGLRMVEYMTRLRSRLLKMPYGDQAIFLPAALFREVGGFPEMPIMEDFEFMRRIRRCGHVAILREAVETSGRRWEKIGILRTSFINQMMVAAYLAGVAPDTLHRWYHGAAARKNS